MASVLGEIKSSIENTLISLWSNDSTSRMAQFNYISNMSRCMTNQHNRMYPLRRFRQPGHTPSPVRLLGSCPDLSEFSLSAKPKSLILSSRASYKMNYMEMYSYDNHFFVFKQNYWHRRTEL